MTWNLFGDAEQGLTWREELCPSAAVLRSFAALHGITCKEPLRHMITPGGFRTHRLFFLTEDNARAAGYRPCGVCLPAAGASCKARKGSV